MSALTFHRHVFRLRAPGMLRPAAAPACPAALAHKPSDSYLTLQTSAKARSRSMGYRAARPRLRDRPRRQPGRRDHLGRTARPSRRHCRLRAGAARSCRQTARRCPTRVVEHLVDGHSDGGYAVLRFARAVQISPTPSMLSASYRLFFDVDPQHRGLLKSRTRRPDAHVIFSASAPLQRIELSAPSRLRQFVDYTLHGVWHIWIGFDHLLFLISLLLPAVLLRVDRAWTGANRFQDAFWEVFKVVTAFTSRTRSRYRWPRSTSSSCLPAGSSRRSPFRSSSPLSTTCS
jgi:hypothetical protein